LYWRQEQESRRATVFFAVLMLHVIVGMIWIKSSLLLSSTAHTAPAEILIAFLQNAAEQKTADENLSGGNPIAKQVSPQKRSTTASEAPKDAFQPDYSFDTRNAITTTTPIDWEHEAELAVQNSIAAAEREKLFRNLAGLSAAQLDWIQKNQMEAVDTNPPWAENRPKNNADGVLWISENCALVNGLPFCRIELGRKPARGDLFKNMRQYLDRRLTDPLP
jgi:hypothetical protein